MWASLSPSDALQDLQQLMASRQHPPAPPSLFHLPAASPFADWQRLHAQFVEMEEMVGRQRMDWEQLWDAMQEEGRKAERERREMMGEQQQDDEGEDGNVDEDEQEVEDSGSPLRLSVQPSAT